MAKVRLFYRRKICYWLIVSVMILMTLNPSLQVIAKESVSDDLTVYTDAGESLELYARSASLWTETADVFYLKKMDPIHVLWRVQRRS